ncbi:hypothetical protein GOBAR_AA33688 [Gossypium barbadense]|uniref:C3H1-type domain-containing protein n=1 Tax=Gossypium barbadense TaxID=3634 RepID=A0A2P5W7G0_GOSBA|nr:hypothetical protein GOBAR_AA33688 [Gossypium barbadense]
MAAEWKSLFDAGISMSRIASAVAVAVTEDVMWQMNLRSSETMESGYYPERPGEPDCSYYIRTGLCRFGATCRFNHPPNRKLAIAAARMKGEFPERVGQPECQACTYSLFSHVLTMLLLLHAIYNVQCMINKKYSKYYLKTGTCKFGATCKFHHPREQAGIAGRVSLNILGYPFRPNETECAYYLRTGQCKFGSTCKFHHPQPTNMMISLRGSPIYPTVASPTTPGQQSYPGGITNWSRASFIPSPRWQGPSSYAPLILPQGMVSVPGWNAYSASVSSSENLQQTNGNNQIYGTLNQNESVTGGSQASFSQFRSGSVPIGFYALPRENVFPERPGQPECQFYMKTGDCKFGAVCRFHHPRERVPPAPDCLLSPIGLPLRPGEPLCDFYSRYGICKFGSSCKFNHPMGIFTYNYSISSPSGAPVHHFLGSSSGTSGLNLSSEGLVESGSTKPRRISLSENRQLSSSDENIDAEG